MATTYLKKTSAAKTPPPATAPETASLEHRRAEVNVAVKTACDYLNSDGIQPRNYVEQLAWMFFLKAYDEAQDAQDAISIFEGECSANPKRESLLTGEYRWSVWSEMTDQPDKMLAFVNDQLWAKLRNLGTSPWPNASSASSPPCKTTVGAAPSSPASWTR